MWGGGYGNQNGYSNICNTMQAPLRRPHARKHEYMSTHFARLDYSNGAHGNNRGGGGGRHFYLIHKRPLVLGQSNNNIATPTTTTRAVNNGLRIGAAMVTYQRLAIPASVLTPAAAAAARATLAATTTPVSPHNSRLRRCRFRCPARRRGMRQTFQHPTCAKVCYSRAPVAGQQHILWLEVPVDAVLTVQVGHACKCTC